MVHGHHQSKPRLAGTMSLLAPAGTVGSTILNPTQSWTFINALAWPTSSTPDTPQSDTSSLLAGNGWTLNILETYNGLTGEGALSLSPLVGSSQLGMNFDMIWDSGETYTLTQVWDVITTDFSGDTLLNPIDLDLSGLTGSTFIGGTYNDLSLSMQFIINTPLPAAFWLFSGGLISVIGFARTPTKL